MFHNKTHNKFNSFLDTQAAFQPFQPPEPAVAEMPMEEVYIEPMPEIEEERKYYPGERLLKKLAKNKKGQKDKKQNKQQNRLIEPDINMIEKSLRGLLNEF
jgi:hypothetical protein